MPLPARSGATTATPGPAAAASRSMSFAATNGRSPDSTISVGTPSSRAARRAWSRARFSPRPDCASAAAPSARARARASAPSLTVWTQPGATPRAARHARSTRSRKARLNARRSASSSTGARRDLPRGSAFAGTTTRSVTGWRCGPRGGARSRPGARCRPHPASACRSPPPRRPGGGARRPRGR